MKAWWYTFFLSLVCSTMLGQKWESNFDTALTKAAQEDKPLVLVFSGSDWCAPCIKLNRTIWQSEEFKKYAAQYYVLYKADFPRKKKNLLPPETLGKNKELAAAFNSKGYFPLVLVLDKNSNILGTTGYQKYGPKEYIQLLDSFLK
ncbi:MAG: thioredoxin family protein [Bacteroidota bacterium]